MSNLLVFTAMAAKAKVCVRPKVKRVTAHFTLLGREAMRKVMAKEHKVARRRMADSSRPEALMTGVCRWNQKTDATARVSRIPFGLDGSFYYSQEMASNPIRPRRRVT